MAVVALRSCAGSGGIEAILCRQSFMRKNLISRTCRRHFTQASKQGNSSPPSKPPRRESEFRWKPLVWYNGHLERNPVRTKCITSAVLFAVGDIIAQKVSAFDSSLDVRRMGRAMVYGGVILGPLSHVHFNFLEWLVVKKLAVRPSLVPFVKMFFDQFGYFSPMTIAIYHVSMGMMEGLVYDDVIKRLKTFYWSSLKACWTMWPIVMVVNFKLVPVRHQLNVVLVACIAWASIQSLIRASGSAGRQAGAIEASETHSHNVAACSETKDLIKV